MWLWPLILLTLLSMPAMAATSNTLSPTSVGPTSKKEADLLWEQGRNQFEQGHFQDAITYLQRLVDRYPGHTGYLESQLFLGKALIEMNRAGEAIKPLKNYASAKAGTPPGVDAKLWLGRAYLAEKKDTEAYLTALEIEKRKGNLDPEFKADALLLKAEALMALNHDSRAAKSMDSAKKMIKQNSNFSSRLKGRAAWDDMHLKTRACSRFPSKGNLTEGQLRDQIERRGTCLLEALVLYRGTLEVQDPYWAKEAQRAVSDAFSDYTSTCSKPLKTGLPKGKRTQTELKRYEEEIAEILQQDCQTKVKSAVDLLDSWKPKFAREMATSLEQVSKNLKLLARLDEGKK